MKKPIRKKVTTDFETVIDQVLEKSYSLGKYHFQTS